MSHDRRDDWDVGLAEVLKVLLDKGTSITADIPITVGDVEVLSLKIQPLLLSSFGSGCSADRRDRHSW